MGAGEASMDASTIRKHCVRGIIPHGYRTAVARMLDFVESENKNRNKFLASMPAAEFKEYYRAVLGLNEDDFQRFESSIEAPLPSTFRVTPTSERAVILAKLQQYSFLTKVEFLENVYTFALNEKTAEYKEFIQFLVGQANIGNIQRQEIVSMIPHLFLNARPNSKVLETCASPGSKTKQLLEVIEDGLVVSNDKSPGRINVLVSEAFKKASGSFVITMMDASLMPNLATRFDRVCCDVPCSSDGTVRKNSALLERWSSKTAIGLHPLQLRILERGLENMRDDGLLVYSTCSLNPIENECVIAKVLELGRYELVLDESRIQYAPESCQKILVRRGITKFSHEGFSFDNPELAKCIRVLPHDQNTGGFFVAVLRRKEAYANAARDSATKEIPAELTKPGERTGCGFYNLPTELCDKVTQKFRPEKAVHEHFVSLTKNFKNIFCLSDSAYEFMLTNPKLKVPYAGIKAFTLTDIGDCSYRAKGAYLVSSGVASDVQGTLADFYKLIKEKNVSASELTFKVAGHFSISFNETPYKFCGFGSANSVFLYIDANCRSALSALHLQSRI